MGHKNAWPISNKKIQLPKFDNGDWGRSLTMTHSPGSKFTSLLWGSAKAFMCSWNFKSFFFKLAKTTSLSDRISSTATTLEVPVRYCGILGDLCPKVTSNGETPVAEWLKCCRTIWPTSGTCPRKLVWCARRLASTVQWLFSGLQSVHLIGVVSRTYPQLYST